MQTSDGHCVVKKLLPVLAGTSPVYNDLDCPLVTTSTRYDVIHSRMVLGPISIVHQCDDSCHSISDSFETKIEREKVVSKKIKGVKHDKNNTLYCINIYCIHYHSVVK